MEQNMPLILIAEDQPMNQKLLSMILDKLGCKSILADNGEEAVEKARKEKPALIFMDLQMPKMDGQDAAKKLRDLGFSMPIIAVTADSAAEESESCRKAGMNDIMVKPVKRAEIEGMLGKWLHGAAGGRTGGGGTAAGSAVSGASVFSAGSAPKGGVFDAAEMLDSFMNNEETVLPLLSRFITRTAAQLENFPALEKAADWESARREAHMIKGAAFTMGGRDTGNAAGVLEMACKEAARDKITAAYLSLVKAFAAFRREAEEFIRSRN